MVYRHSLRNKSLYWDVGCLENKNSKSWIFLHQYKYKGYINQGSWEKQIDTHTHSHTQKKGLLERTGSCDYRGWEEQTQEEPTV